MKNLCRRFRFWTTRAALALALATTAAVVAGCDTDDDFDHDPPPGQGTLYVDNNTGDDIRVYINGTRVETTDSGETEYYDLRPGVYRVVLNGADNDRSFADDVDILEGQRTIMDVSIDIGDYRDFDVFIRYR